MIVRIFNDQQYRLDDGLHGELNDLDDAVVAAVDAGDESAYLQTFAALLRFVRDRGTPLPEDELVGSDVLIPADDFSFDEAGREFTGEGLVPDPAEA
ncbi:PspA-associated protein PspAA [Patulibacter sp. S7RM1-6]